MEILQEIAAFVHNIIVLRSQFINVLMVVYQVHDALFILNFGNTV